ncbi:hypothetical protein O181_083421 [Austropuccinia psidii MF-1]|uniref:Integrase catalytic domain-containing protein n=1 Tax=Austropuccinia psidii MF-1 TaxID=1389203 RepID=A0A9Q3FP09_9BASI|nr:hypothetical protein [Austropuccinia psidii MF-1]
MMIQIKEPKYYWEIVQMDWVTALPPGGDSSCNACLVLVDRYRKTPIFLPFNKVDTAMNTAIMIWSNVISHTGLFQNIISDRDPNFTSALWKNLHYLFGTKLSFSTASHPQTDALELAYKKSIHSSAGKTPAILEEGWNPRLPYDTLKKDLVDTHPTASSFKLLIDKARDHPNRCIQDSFKYAKERWDKSHKPPDFQRGELVLVSTLNFNNIKGAKKLKDYFAGPFMIKALHEANAVQLELTGELMRKHPIFPVSMIKPYSSSDKELFPLRNKPPLEIAPLEEGE